MADFLDDQVLVEFSVSNFMSIQEPVTLKMSSTKGSEHRNTNTIKSDVRALSDLVSTAVIYGPNASGKSNLIRAMSTMENIVLESAGSAQSGDKLNITSFRLNETSRNLPSEFNVVFVVDSVRYEYGFAASEKRIFEEWLFAYPKGRAQQWIDRSYDSENDRYEWGSMDKLTGKKQTWQSATRSNALFLSTAVQLNNQQLEPVFNWFAKTLRVIGFGGIYPTFTARTCAEDNSCDKVVKFLKNADIDIEMIEVKQEIFDAKKLSGDMPEAFREEIERDLQGKLLYEVRTGHLSNKGSMVFFDLDEESDGTKKLFSIAGPWLDTLKNGYVLFIDELNDSLHPKIVKSLITMFHDKKINKKNAQLIFSTHDTTILNQDLFRRDQIWFCEKNEDQATNLFPLTDFKPRKGYENFEKSYLAGRYGAIPYTPFALD